MREGWWSTFFFRIIFAFWKQMCFYRMKGHDQNFSKQVLALFRPRSYSAKEVCPWEEIRVVNNCKFRDRIHLQRFASQKNLKKKNTSIMLLFEIFAWKKSKSMSVPNEVNNGTLFQFGNLLETFVIPKMQNFVADGSCPFPANLRRSKGRMLVLKRMVWPSK